MGRYQEMDTEVTQHLLDRVSADLSENKISHRQARGLQRRLERQLQEQQSIGNKTYVEETPRRNRFDSYDMESATIEAATEVNISTPGGDLSPRIIAWSRSVSRSSNVSRDANASGVSPISSRPTSGQWSFPDFEDLGVPLKTTHAIGIQETSPQQSPGAPQTPLSLHNAEDSVDTTRASSPEGLQELDLLDDADVFLVNKKVLRLRQQFSKKV